MNHSEMRFLVHDCKCSFGHSPGTVQ